MKPEEIEDRIRKLDDFAPTEQTRALLRELFAEGEADICRLATQIERDLALSTQLLRLANSAYFGFPRRVGTVHEAVMIMGLRNVSDLVSSLSVAVNLVKMHGDLIDFRELWSHSSGTAEAARIVARDTKAPSELAFTAGLLHDVGMLVLATVVPGPYGRVLERSSAEDVSLIDAERELLGVDHQWAGGILLDQWEFPYGVVDAARTHHDPPEDAEPLTLVVSVANVLAAAEGLQEPHQHLQIPGFPDAARERLEISDALFEDMVRQIHERREAIELIVGETLGAIG